MRAVFGLVLIVGIALAGGAVMMAKNYISAYQQELANRETVVPTVDVFVADRSLRYGETLTKEAVRRVRWTVDSVPEGSFTDLDALFPPNASGSRYVLRAMEKGEAIMLVKVTKPGEDAGLTSRIERGMRAFAIKVDVASGVSGFLRPGDRVDIYWTGSIRDAVEGARGDVTRLIEARVQLIAIDQSASGILEGATIARTVTVSVRPQQVAALAQAQSTGKLSLSLVGPEDDTIASVIEVNQRSLLGLGEVEAAPVKIEKRICTIRQRRGAEVMEIPIPCVN
jgi:pilus assembly protein CpaB